MRKILSLIVFTFSLAFSSGQDNTNTTKVSDPLQLKETAHDFGMIPQGKPVYHDFEIVNTGNTAVSLEQVTVTCGCTTPEWSRDPIAPGASTFVKVGYNSAAEGYFEKPISVIYNGSQSKQIIIKGTVWKAPTGAAPPNASVQLLKQSNQ